DGIRDFHVTGVQTCALPISPAISINNLPKNDCGVSMSGKNKNKSIKKPTNSIFKKAPIFGQLFNSKDETARMKKPTIIDQLPTRSEERRVGKERRTDRTRTT